MRLNVKTEQLITPEQNSLTEYSIQQISEILFDADSGFNFASWFQNYEDTFRSTSYMFRANDVRFLLRKLDTFEQKGFMNFILPKYVEVISVEETILTFFQNYLMRDVQIYRNPKTA